MTLKATLIAGAAMLAMAPAAHAYEGLYGAIGAGLSYINQDQDIEATSGPLLFDANADYKNGVGAYSALGYEYGNGWRTELEFSYRRNHARQWVGDNLSFSGFPGSTLSGDVKSYSIMANLIRDLNPSGAINPFVGIGAGAVRISQNLTGVNPVALNGFSPMSVNDSDWAFGYQALGGFAIRVAEGVTLDVSYRYLRAHRPNFAGVIAATPFAYEAPYHDHSVFAGFRWNFGPSQAAPQVQYKDCWDGSSVPVTADCPPQLVEKQAAVPEPVGFVVYFDYDKSNLTPEAQNLIREAAQRALANNIQTVKVEGNADRSGSSAYNQALSLRRANVVRDALIANGVPADRIQTFAYGEDRPAKPTPDGVREPLNRRTEVTISFE
ncbi:MAG: OmpA family protein [Alphaproteobacteria bacterium]|nr:OmpA family protein [Alphaproteobacteria bacterium]